MNRQRRKMLSEVLDQFDILKDPIERDDAVSIITHCFDEVSLCADLEQDALDNRPESLMFSTANEEMQENVDDLYEASGDLESIIESCEEMEKYDYEKIKSDICSVIGTIKKVISK